MVSHSDSKQRSADGGRRVLPVIEVSSDEGSACTTCRSNDWIWDEEVELVQAMNGIKQEVRDARAKGDEGEVRRLRDEFKDLRAKLEKARRRRLDAFGWYDYD